MAKIKYINYNLKISVILHILNFCSDFLLSSFALKV